MMKRWLYALGLVPLVVVAFAGLDLSKATRRAPEPLSPPERADRLLVEKGARRLTLFRDGLAIARYDVALGSSPTGDKEREGDGRTPEGRYVIDLRNARSAFHLSLRISYPDAADREGAQQHGVPPGGDIMIHGLPNGLAMLGPLHRLIDWTDGCIAVTNSEIQEIWALTDVGVAIEIKE